MRFLRIHLCCLWLTHVKQQESHGLGLSYVSLRKTGLIEHYYQQTEVYRPCAKLASLIYGITHKRLPTKCCNVGKDWSLVKGFNINYANVLSMSEQRQRRWVFSVFCVQGSGPKQITNDKVKLHTGDIIKLETHILSGSQRSIKIII